MMSRGWKLKRNYGLNGLGHKSCDFSNPPHLCKVLPIPYFRKSSEAQKSWTSLFDSKPDV